VRAEHGHPNADTLPMSRETFVAPTREQAVATVGPYLEGKYRAYAAWGQDKALPGEEDFTAPFEDLAAGRFVVGSPDNVTADLQCFADLGVTHASLRFGWPGTPRQVVERGDPPRRPRDAAGAAVAGTSRPVTPAASAKAGEVVGNVSREATSARRAIPGGSRRPSLRCDTRR